jgi:hypothetical protein
MCNMNVLQMSESENEGERGRFVPADGVAAGAQGEAAQHLVSGTGEADGTRNAAGGENGESARVLANGTNSSNSSLMPPPAWAPQRKQLVSYSSSTAASGPAAAVPRKGVSGAAAPSASSHFNNFSATEDEAAVEAAVEICFLLTLHNQRDADFLLQTLQSVGNLNLFNSASSNSTYVVASANNNASNNTNKSIGSLNTSNVGLSAGSQPH